MQFALLPYRGLIRLSGEDTLPFLQGLASNDVLRLPEAGAVYTALLTPQGKFLHDFFIVNWQGAVILDCEKDRMPDLLKRLNMYRLRSKVAMEAIPDSFGVGAAWGEDTVLADAPSLRIFSDPRLKTLGYRALGDITTLQEWCSQQGFTTAGAQDYDRMRLEVGVPDGSRDLEIDKSTLLPFGFEPLHGVDFTKGCYVGQEVTARTKHIGQMRKYIHKLQLQSGILPARATPVTVNGEIAGHLCSHTDDIGLAFMSLEMVEKAHISHSDFHCGDAIVKVELPAWATF